MKTFNRTQLREVFENWQNTPVGTCKCKEIQVLGVLDFLDYLATFQFSQPKPITPDYNRKEIAMSEDRAKGKIKWFNKQKGYGFVTTDDGDVFIHCSAVPAYKEGVLDEGVEVEFDVFQSTKGPQARDVVIL